MLLGAPQVQSVRALMSAVQAPVSALAVEVRRRRAFRVAPCCLAQAQVKARVWEVGVRMLGRRVEATSALR